MMDLDTRGLLSKFAIVVLEHFLQENKAYFSHPFPSSGGCYVTLFDLEACMFQEEIALLAALV